MEKHEYVIKHLKFIKECEDAMASNYLWVMQNEDDFTDEDKLSFKVHNNELLSLIIRSRKLISKLN